MADFFPIKSLIFSFFISSQHFLLQKVTYMYLPSVPFVYPLSDECVIIVAFHSLFLVAHQISFLWRFDTQSIL